jgi:nicotinamide-nucleotide amidase
LKQRTVNIFCIGRELLAGEVLDRNAHYMAGRIHKAGYRVRSIQVLDGIEEEVVPAFERVLGEQPAFLLITGGMGPGHDDITRQCLAQAAGVPLELDPEAEEMLAESYKRVVARGVIQDPELTEDRLIMAKVPKGCRVFPNTIGLAPIVNLEIGRTKVFAMPGMPEELRRTFTEYVLPAIEADGAGIYRDSRFLDYPSADESTMARMLADLSRRHQGVFARARAQGQDDKTTLRITLTAEDSDQETIAERLDAAVADLRARLGLEVQGSSSRPAEGQAEL